MLRTKFLTCVCSLVLCAVSASGYAQDTVIGQLKAESSLLLNPGANQHRVGKDTTAYIQGDIVSTNADSSATLVLSSSGNSLTIAANSLVSVDLDKPVAINLRDGGLGFSVGAGDELSIVSPNGEFSVSSDLGASAVAVFKDGELAIISNQGNLLVSSQMGDAVTVVDEQHAFIISNSNKSQVVNVQLGGGGASTKWLLWLAAAAAAALVIDNNSGSNNSAPAPTPPASPAS